MALDAQIASLLDKRQSHWFKSRKIKTGGYTEDWDYIEDELIPPHDLIEDEEDEELIFDPYITEGLLRDRTSRARRKLEAEKLPWKFPISPAKLLGRRKNGPHKA